MSAEASRGDEVEEQEPALDAAPPPTLAEAVRDSFVGFDVGAGQYVIELLAPEEPAEVGGPALQYLRLRPQRSGFGVVLAGSVNTLEKFAELRTYEHACLAHQLRFDKALEIRVNEWERLLRAAEAILRFSLIETARVGPPPQLLRDAREAREKKKTGQRISPGAMVVFLVVLALAAAVMLRVVQTVRHGG